MGKRLGYKYVYMPKHHRASKDGEVYEHILKAEEYLGRPLLDEEVVHHKDRNRANNSKENLMVFATKADHSRFHSINVCELIGDHYIAPEQKIKCKYCGKEFVKNNYDQQFCSCECCSLFQRKANRPSKEELLDLINKYPFTYIGKMYGVTDNAIRKWCKQYGLPYRKKDI